MITRILLWGLNLLFYLCRPKKSSMYPALDGEYSHNFFIVFFSEPNIPREPIEQKKSQNLVLVPVIVSDIYFNSSIYIYICVCVCVVK